MQYSRQRLLSYDCKTRYKLHTLFYSHILGIETREREQGFKIFLALLPVKLSPTNNCYFLIQGDLPIDFTIKNIDETQAVLPHMVKFPAIDMQ